MHTSAAQAAGRGAQTTDNPHTDSRLAWMAHSLGQAGVPYGWLQPHDLSWGHINPAMQQLLQRQGMLSGRTPAQCWAQLQAAAAQCLARRAVHHEAAAYMHWVLEPVTDAQGHIVAIQCLARSDDAQQVQRLQQVL